MQLGRLQASNAWADWKDLKGMSNGLGLLESPQQCLQGAQRAWGQERPRGNGGVGEQEVQAGCQGSFSGQGDVKEVDRSKEHC